MTEEEVLESLEHNFREQLSLIHQALQSLRRIIEVQGERLDNLESWCRALETRMQKQEDK